MIVPLTLPQALQVCRNMSDEDFAEVSAINWHGEANDFVDAFALEATDSVGPKYCLLKDGEPIAIGGLTPSSPGVLNVFGVSTGRVHEVIAEYTLFGKKMIQSAFENPQVNRVHAVTGCTHHQAHRWLNMIGLSWESSLSHFGRNGEDYFMYARVRNVRSH